MDKEQHLKTCGNCGETKELTEFYLRHGKPRSKCKACWAAQSRSHYEQNRERAYERARSWKLANPERTKEVNRASREKHRDKWNAYAKRYHKAHPLKRKAHSYVALAIQNGDLTRLPCEICGNENGTTHHDSYEPGYWLKVRWLCRSCHSKWHHGTL